MCFHASYSVIFKCSVSFICRFIKHLIAVYIPFPNLTLILQFHLCLAKHVYFHRCSAQFRRLF